MVQIPWNQPMKSATIPWPHRCQVQADAKVRRAGGGQGTWRREVVLFVNYIYIKSLAFWQGGPPQNVTYIFEGKT